MIESIFYIMIFVISSLIILVDISIFFRRMLNPEWNFWVEKDIHSKISKLVYKLTIEP